MARSHNWCTIYSIFDFHYKHYEDNTFGNYTVLCFVFTAESVAITLKVDSIPYTNGIEVQLLEGPHTFECIASNAELNMAVIWDFNGHSVGPNDISTMSKGSLQDVVSTVIRHRISGDDCGTSVKCSVMPSCSPGVQGFLTTAIIVKVFSKYFWLHTEESYFSMIKISKNKSE